MITNLTQETLTQMRQADLHGWMSDHATIQFETYDHALNAYREIEQVMGKQNGMRIDGVLETAPWSAYITVIRGSQIHRTICFMKS